MMCIKSIHVYPKLLVPDIQGVYHSILGQYSLKKLLLSIIIYFFSIKSLQSKFRNKLYIWAVLFHMLSVYQCFICFHFTSLFEFCEEFLRSWYSTQKSLQSDETATFHSIQSSVGETGLLNGMGLTIASIPHNRPFMYNVKCMSVQACASFSSGHLMLQLRDNMKMLQGQEKWHVKRMDASFKRTMMMAGQRSDAETMAVHQFFTTSSFRWWHSSTWGGYVCVCVIKSMWVCIFSLFHTVSVRVQTPTRIEGSLPASNLNDSSCPSDPTFPRVTSPLMEIRLPGILQKSPPSQASLLIHRGTPGRRHVNVVRWAAARFVNHVWCRRGKAWRSNLFSTRKLFQSSVDSFHYSCLLIWINTAACYIPWKLAPPLLRGQRFNNRQDIKWDPVQLHVFKRRTAFIQ